MPFFPKRYGYTNSQFKNHILSITNICAAVFAIWSDVFKSDRYRFLGKQESMEINVPENVSGLRGNLGKYVN